MKRKIFTLFCLLIILSGCNPNLFVVRNFSIVPWIPSYINNWFAGGLTPDGSTLNLASFDQINLFSGQLTSIFSEYSNQLGPEIRINTQDLSTSAGWSSDGRYLAITNSSEYLQGRMLINHAFIIDTEEQSIIQLPEPYENIYDWSPFNNDRVILSNRYEDQYFVVELESLRVIPLTTQVDFKNEEEVGGTGEYLWSRSLNLPIGFLTSSEINRPLWADVYINSSSELFTESEPDYSVLVFPNPAAGAIFDPTGEYVLIAEWVCGTVEDNQPCDWETAGVDDISDTILTLVNWRTGEQQELFRLSEIGDGANVGYGSAMYWSADGSTILLGRYGASPVVLTVQYP